MRQVFKVKGKDGPFKRATRIPPVQFMIIGNKLFEFTIDESGPPYEIFNTQVISDRRYIRAYLETFKLIKEAFVVNEAEGEKGEGASAKPSVIK
jgi:hypothetical protein